MVDRQFSALKAVIKGPEGEILLLRESGDYEEGTNEGSFDLPGGRIEPGEEPREALKREIREETGLCVELEKPFHTAEWRPEVGGETWQVIGTYLSATTETRDVELSEDHSGCRWVKPGDTENLELISGLKEVLKSYARTQNEHTLPKLVRDGIPEIIRRDGSSPEYSEVENTENHLDLLAEKLVEEAEEFLEDREMEGLADVLEVIDSYLEISDADPEELNRLRQNKAENRGRFDLGYILENVEDKGS